MIASVFFVVCQKKLSAIRSLEIRKAFSTQGREESGKEKAKGEKVEKIDTPDTTSKRRPG